MLRREVSACAPKSNPDTSRTDPPEGFPIHAIPAPRDLRRDRPAGSDDPSLRKMSIGIKPLQRNKKIHSGSKFLWINCCKTCGKPEGCRFVKALQDSQAGQFFPSISALSRTPPGHSASPGPWRGHPALCTDSPTRDSPDLPTNDRVQPFSPSTDSFHAA